MVFIISIHPLRERLYLAASVRTFSDLFIASVQVFADTPFVLKDIPSTFIVSSSCMFSGNFSVGDPNTKALPLFGFSLAPDICENL